MSATTQERVASSNRFPLRAQRPRTYLAAARRICASPSDSGPEHNAPERRDDRLEQHLLLTTKLQDYQGKMGTPDQGLTINLHEYGHAVFDVNAQTCAKSYWEKRLLSARLTTLFDQIQILEGNCQLSETCEGTCYNKPSIPGCEPAAPVL